MLKLMTTTYEQWCTDIYNCNLLFEKLGEMPDLALVCFKIKTYDCTRWKISKKCGR